MALLEIRCESPGVAERMAEVLAPDNRGTPSDQRFTMKREGASVTFRVESADMPRAASTLLSVLSDSALFQEVWLLSRGSDAAVGRHP
jgi:hypothetical protein